MTPKSGTDKIQTTNTYSQDQNLLYSVTQRGAYTTNYTYASVENKMRGQASSVKDPSGLVASMQYDALGRLISTSQAGSEADLRASYTYDNYGRAKSISYSIPGVVDKATESFHYNDNSTDSISDGSLTGKALFSNIMTPLSRDLSMRTVWQVPARATLATICLRIA